MKKDPKKEIYRICKSEIPDFEELLDLAFGLMDRMGKSFQSAAPELYDEIDDIIREYGPDFGVDTDNVTPEDIIYI